MKTFNLIKRLLCLCALTCLTVSALWAQNRNDDKDLDKTLSPYFVVISDNGETDNLPLKETSVKTNIVGSIADVTVRQLYVNAGKSPIEAIYTFPMSTKAAVYGMQMRIGNRIVRAQIEEKKKARQDYEKAKSEGKRASLLEQSRPNVFTMNVSNVMAGDTIEVELKYTELLVPNSGTYTFVYPTVVGPRYSKTSQSHAGPDDDFVSTPYTHEGVMPTYTFDYELTINSGIPIQDVVCSSHKMKIAYPDTKQCVVRLDESEKNGGNRDVNVSYSLQGNEIASGVLLYEGADENFFLMMVQPPKKVLKENIPPREYIFIVDVSGSMWGFPMEVSKKLMRNLIVNLKPTDYFNVVLFSSNLKVFSPTSVAATEANVNEAQNFIAGGNNWGGTELIDALKEAYALPRLDEDVSRTFVVLTDGYVDVEKEAFETIRKNCGNTNLFAFGIGSSVNHYIIEGMAFAGNGEPFVVTKENEAAKQAENFRNYINTPVLTRIKLNTGSLNAYDIEPEAVPDMLAERPIMIFGKYKGKAQGTLTLTGKVGRKNYKQTFDLSQVKPDTTNSALRYLWARERIKYLDYLLGQYSREDNPVAKQILELGLKYNLMTNYTSFVAIDEEIVNKDGKQQTVKQAIPLPEGVSDYAVGYDAGTVIANNSIARMSSKIISIGVEEEIEEEEEEVFIVIEDDPEFPGGMDSMIAFLARNIVYPKQAKKAGIEGRVYITFVVEKDGSVSNVKCIRDIGGGCGAEAVRVVKMMPKWKPGRQRGVAVRTQFTLPVQFTIPKE